MLKLKCTGCGSDLRLTFGYSGADWNTVKGNGSGVWHRGITRLYK